MPRILVLLLFALLALGSLSGYLILNRLTIAGSMKVAAGKLQIAQGENKLASGKARLASGERELSNGKKMYGTVNQTPLLAAMSIIAAPLAVAALAEKKVVGSKVAEGDKEVAAGQEKVAAGEKQLAAGKMQLQQGIERLDTAKLICSACGYGAILFTVLFFVLFSDA